jgi:hypothetical protein
MIVYRDQRSRADPHLLLLQLRSTASQFCSSGPDHDDAIELIMEAGVLESGVADALFFDQDGIHPLVDSLRQASVEAGHVLWHSWHGNHGQAHRWGARLAQTLREAPAHLLPGTVEVSVPEGYAYYAVYPEMYLEAAKRFHARTGRCDCVCMGIRSIGASLSAVVAATLEELGSTVQSLTLRPRGHPFSRRPRLSGELMALLQARPAAFFLLIDEGPGISGSSLGGIAAMLQSWGIENDRVVLFPSWQTDGSHLSSLEGRQQWRQHPRITASFEEVWIESARLATTFPGELRDISAGAWRPEVYSHARDYPAVQPQHERRKYLLTGSGKTADPHLLSFAGLGRRTSRKVERLARVAEAGFTVGPEKLAHGFLLRRFVGGSPVSAELVDLELIERAAAYLAYLSREHAAEPTVDDESLREMITLNVEEGLQLSLDHTLRDALPASAWTERPVALDGRMLRHEWIRAPHGILKMDAMDHHDDHFFPGCQDIAWDVAAAAFELGLDAQSRGHLVDRYRRLSGDLSISSRLDHYAMAYLAFRLGYATLAGSVLGKTPDGHRFAGEVQRYAGLLLAELNASPARRYD